MRLLNPSLTTIFLADADLNLRQIEQKLLIGGLILLGLANGFFKVLQNTAEVKHF